jgi:hypothetical protein
MNSGCRRPQQRHTGHRDSSHARSKIAAKVADCRCNYLWDRSVAVGC